MVRVSYSLCAIIIFEIVLWSCVFIQPDCSIRSYVNDECTNLSFAQPGSPNSATHLPSPSDSLTRFREADTFIQSRLLVTKQSAFNRLEASFSTFRPHQVISLVAFVLPLLSAPRPPQTKTSTPVTFSL